MNIDLKDIHLGSLIYTRTQELGIHMERICSFLKCSENEIEAMYKAESVDTAILLRWSKLLEYDFFRIYSQHLILYSPPSAASENAAPKKTALPLFRKNIYTREIINFILELLNSGQKTKVQIREEYRIPKSTLHKWIDKYNTTNETTAK